MKTQKNNNSGDVVNGDKIINGPDETMVKGIVRATIEETMEDVFPQRINKRADKSETSVLADLGQREETLGYEKLKMQMQTYQNDCNLLEKKILKTESEIKYLTEGSPWPFIVGLIFFVVWQITWITLKILDIIGDFAGPDDFASWILYIAGLGIGVGFGIFCIALGLATIVCPNHENPSPSLAIKIKKAQQEKERLEQDLKISKAKLNSAKKELSKYVSALSNTIKFNKQ